MMMLSSIAGMMFSIEQSTIQQNSDRPGPRSIYTGKFDLNIGNAGK